MPYTKFEFNFTSCRAFPNSIHLGLKPIMSALTGINHPLLRIFDANGKEIGVTCVVNSLSVQAQHNSMLENVTLGIGVFAFENEIATVFRSALSSAFTFEIGEWNTRQGFKFEVGLFSSMNFANGDYEIHGLFAMIGEETAVNAYAEVSPMVPANAPISVPWPVNPTRLPPPPPTSLPVSNACSNWGWNTDENTKEETKPNPRYCRHEAVNVGFNHIKLVCKKCDKELPPDYKPGDYVTNDDWETF